VGTESIECDRILTDEDFKMMKRLRKQKAADTAEKNNPRLGAAPAIHMPDFDFLSERTKLKKLSQKMQREFEEDHRREEKAARRLEAGEVDGEEEEDDEDAEEEEFGEEEELEEAGMDEEEIEGEDEDGMDEEEIEDDGDEEEDDGEIEGDEEGDEEELEIGEDDGEVIEKTATEDDDSDMVGSSFYEESESEDFQPSSGFLQASSILNRDTFKRKVTRDQIKLVKAEQRDEHKKLKLGAKIKQRGRLTNRQKQKNNPYQMFIQKKKLQNRLKDLKKEQKMKKFSKNHKGHQRSNRLGKSGAKKF
jgi:hypothetical protein